MRNFQNKVRVIRLWKWNNFQVELCIFKPGSNIDWHQHNNVNVEVMHIWGNATYQRCNPDSNFKFGPDCYEAFIDCKSKYVTNFDTLKCFSVPSNYWHRAIIGNIGLITLSIQRWKIKPSLITEDYHASENTIPSCSN